MGHKNVLGLIGATLLGYAILQYRSEPTKVPEARKFSSEMVHHFDKNCSDKIDIDDFEAEFRSRTIPSPYNPRERLLPVADDQGVYRSHGGQPEFSIVLEFPFKNYCPKNKF